MKSTIDTISLPLLTKYGITQEHFDAIISIYFKETRKALKSLDKPEIALLWGTLIPGRNACEKEINTINVYLKNRDTEINKKTDEQLLEKEQSRDKLIKLLDYVITLRTEGKTERGKQGKLKKKLKNETQTDNTK